MIPALLMKPWSSFSFGLGRNWSRGCAQSVGISTPLERAASRMERPWGTETDLPLTERRTVESGSASEEVEVEEVEAREKGRQRGIEEIVDDGFIRLLAVAAAAAPRRKNI